MNKQRNRYSYSTISLGGIVRENLPFPYVHYPGHYGVFFSFSKTDNSSPFMCECSKSSIYNYFELRKLIVNESQNYQYDIGNHFDQQYLPKAIVQLIRKNDDPVNNLSFKRAICHRCNLSPPTMRYCHEMYGVKFVQYFGWYIKQAYLRFGILGTAYLDGITPSDYIKDILFIREAITELSKAQEWFHHREEFIRQRMVDPSIILPDVGFDEISKRQEILRIAQRNANRAERILSKKIENIVREEFGQKKVGESWTSETIVYQIVCRLFPGYQILFHHRPKWLDGLELDIFIPDIQLGIEYQGQQHFHPIKLWGGEKALKELQERDAIKTQICKKNNVTLITFDYTEPLTADYIHDVIGKTNQSLLVNSAFTRIDPSPLG